MKINELTRSLESWLKNQELEEISKNTLRVYANSINKLIDYLKKEKIQTLDKHVLIEYKSYLKNSKLKTSTINVNIVSINKFLKYLNLEHFCIKQISVQKRFNNEKVLSLQDYKRLLRQAKKHNMIKIQKNKLEVNENGK